MLARYALHEAWSSKITIGLFVLSLLPCLVDLVIIYVANNPIARALIMRGGPSLDYWRRLLPEGAGDAVLVCAGACGVDRAPARLVRSCATTPSRSCSAIPSRASAICWANFIALAAVALLRHLDSLPAAVCLPVLCFAAAVGDGAPVARRSAFSQARSSGSCCSRLSGWPFRPG